MWSSRACKFSENFATVKDKSESEPHSVASLLLFAHTVVFLILSAKFWSALSAPIKVGAASRHFEPEVPC
jgi:hypothetical protein